MNPISDTGLHVRPATEGDLTAINDIYNFYVRTATATFDLEEVTLAERRDWYAHHGERYPVLVAEAAGEFVGWCSLSPFRARPGYRYTVEDSVYIRDDWRGRGVGRLLLQGLLAKAERLGYHSVMALIGDSDNQASIALHASLGFQQVGIEREVGYKFGRWLDVVVMQWFPTEGR
ncbi:MAG: N-acetyltransferase [Chloroflexi bacterium]|nr:N-acetyltransferase [Chloroflexota bacterium]